jgi:heme exporter protein B
VTGADKVLVVLGRELAVEASGRHLSRVAGPFALAGVLLGGLAFGPVPSVLRAVAPGLPWLVVLLLAAPLSLSVAVAEREDGCWDLLRSLAGPGPLLGGKLLAMWLWLAATWTVTAGLTVVVLGAGLPLAAVPAALLGTLGLAGAVVVYGTTAAAAGRAGTGLLTALVLPAGLPALLAGTQAGTPGVDAAPWLALLIAYDLAGLAVAWAVFPTLLEE